MDDLSQLDETNEETIYTFRFTRNDKVLHINQEEVDCIPYLSHLVKYNDNCSSVRNEDGEYLLDAQIRSNWFLPIFESMKRGHSSMLFIELSQEANVFGMIELYDYLCLNPIPFPLLKDQYLVRTKDENIDKDKYRIEYRRAKNRLEVRDTTAELIVSLARNEYNFDHSNTIDTIFSLIMIVISNPKIFHVRLCLHLLTVTENICFVFFSPSQQAELRKTKKFLRNPKNHSFIHSDDGQRKLPQYFQNAFAWKGISVPIQQENNDDLMIISSPEPNPPLYHIFRGHFIRFLNIDFSAFHTRWIDDIQEDIGGFNLQRDYFDQSSNLNEERKQMEAKSARSGHFNTQPQRAKIDKFKHRVGPKAKKHR